MTEAERWQEIFMADCDEGVGKMHDDDTMTYEEFVEDQMKRKGYVCPANDWNPDYHGESVVEFCPTCEHWKKDCIIYGKKAMAKAGNWERN